MVKTIRRMIFPGAGFFALSLEYFAFNFLQKLNVSLPSFRLKSAVFRLIQRGSHPGRGRQSNFLSKIALMLAIFLAIASAAKAAPETPPGSFVSVCSAIVYDLDNDAILFEQNADQRIPPASLTKVLSMFLAMDFIKNGHSTPDTLVEISRAAATAGGSSMGLRYKEKVPLEKLLLGMAVSSGNDASHAVAEHVGGSAQAFVRMMNARAASLGMNDSHFENPHGLPAANQYTTARDMLTLARAYLMTYPDALEMHNTRVLTHGGYTSWNKNPLLGQYPGADGLKTGWIRASGYNLIFTARKGDRRLLAVILGAPDTGTRGAEACRLLDAGFMVCGNAAVSVAAALDSIPFDATRIDPRKTARDAGIYKARAAKKYIAKARKGKKILYAGKKVKSRKYAQNKRYSTKNRGINAGKVKRKVHAEGRSSRGASRRG